MPDTSAGIQWAVIVALSSVVITLAGILWRQIQKSLDRERKDNDRLTDLLKKSEEEKAKLGAVLKPLLGVMKNIEKRLPKKGSTDANYSEPTDSGD